MNRERMTLRDGCAALLGGAFMLAAMVLAQCLDGYDKKKEEEALRAAAVSVGFREGMARLRCIGGLRYDTGTGQYVDVAKRGRDE